LPDAKLKQLEEITLLLTGAVAAAAASGVFWPAWEWGPMNMPYLRHLAFGYAQDLTTRDNNKLVKLVTSPSYRALWGDRFEMIKIGETRPENDHTGFVLATSVTGAGTGERGDRTIPTTSSRSRAMT
jgi:hypothetical protein